VKHIASTRWCTALAVLAYLLVSLFTLRDALQAPSIRLAYPAVLDNDPGHLRLDHQDQSMVVATTIRNAHLLSTSPGEMFSDFGQCFPSPKAYTLGEHMFGLGLLATPMWMLSGDPLQSFNAALVATLWFAGIAMYALSLHFTRNPAAAFVAGLAFLLVPGRIIDPSHPYVHGDLWAPAIILFLHRLFLRARWADSLALAFFANLALAESLYPILSTAIVLSIFGPYLLWQHRQRLGEILPKLALSVGITLLGAWVILGPYLETRSTWALESRQLTTMLPWRVFLPGEPYFPGFGVSALAGLALWDRARRARPIGGDDPRIALLLGGALLAWCATRVIYLPMLNLAIESPLAILRYHVSGLGAVRALFAIAIGLGISTSLLVGYGALFLIERAPGWRFVSLWTAIALSMGLLLARFEPGLAQRAFGRPTHLSSWEARPPDADIELIKRIGPGPLFDHGLAGTSSGNLRLEAASALLLSSYAPRSQAACYNSFASPINEQIAILDRELPSRQSLDAIAAIGFETLLIRLDSNADPGTEVAWEEIDGDADEVQLLPIGRTDNLIAFTIVPPSVVTEKWSDLGPTDSTGSAEALMPRDTLEFTIGNRGDRAFVQPKPLLPEALLVTWEEETDGSVFESRVDALLPVALARDDSFKVSIEADTPHVPGTYRVRLSRIATPEQPLAQATIVLPRLQGRLPPAEVAQRMHEPVLKEILAAGLTSMQGTSDSVELLTVSPPLEVGREIDLEAHYIVAGATPLTLPFTGIIERTSAPDRVRIEVPLPPDNAFGMLLVTGRNEPERLIGGRLVFVSSASSP
jgi:hypothetical protein